MLVATNIAQGVLVLAYIFTDQGWGAGAVLPLICHSRSCYPR